MKRFALLGAAALLVAAGAPNWTATISKSAIGGHVMGNPAAKAKLVEYISYTCGHCAEFTAEASAPLKRGYVSTGKVSVEFRNAVRDQFDLTAALAARCGGAAKFFGNAEAILVAQPVWLNKAQAWANANASKMQGQPMNVVLIAAAKGLGLDTLMAKRGITASQLNACLVDKVSQQQVLAMTKDAFEVRKLTGTPGFVLNGQKIDHAHNWAEVENHLKTALAAK